MYELAKRGNEKELTALLKTFENDGSNQKVLNHISSSGQTALTNAVFCGNGECVKALIHAQADPNMKNQSGATPLDMAADTFNREIEGILRQCGATAKSSG